MKDSIKIEVARDVSSSNYLQYYNNEKSSQKKSFSSIMRLF